MSKNNPKSKAVSLFLLVLVVVLGSVLTYISVTSKSKISKISQMVTSESEGIKEDPMKDWKTYTNEGYGFEFRYPSSWYIEIDGMPDNYLRVQNFDPKTAPARGYDKSLDQGRFGIIFDAWNNRNLNVKTTRELQEKLAKESCLDGKEKVVSNNQEKVVGSVIIYSRDTICTGYLSSGLERAYFLLDGKGKIVEVHLALDAEFGIQYLDQILSTFKFVNGNEDNLIIDDDSVDVFKISPLGKEWSSVEYCGVKHKEHVSMKSTYHNELTDNNTCFFGYDFGDLVGLTIPAELVTAVFKGYDGGSRREYYFSHMVDENEDRRYSGSESFELNGKSWLKLNWVDINPDNDYFSPKVVYLSAEGDTLVAVEGSGQYGYRSFDDSVKKFLASFDF